MTDPAAPTVAQDERGARILHAILAVGIALILAVFMLLLRLVGPYVPPGRARPIVAYVAAGLGLVAMLAALAVLRPLARGRFRDAPAGRRWSDTTRGPAILVWIVAEWGAIAGALGFLLTGSTLPAAVAALGFVTLLWCSPGRLSSF